LSVVEQIRRGGGEASAVQVDVRSEKSIETMVKETLRQFGQVDILVNCAAIGSNTPPVRISGIATCDPSRG